MLDIHHVTYHSIIDEVEVEVEACQSNESIIYYKACTRPALRRNSIESSVLYSNGNRQKKVRMT
jgi:hypothetical protein